MGKPGGVFGGWFGGLPGKKRAVLGVDEVVEVHLDAIGILKSAFRPVG